MDKVEWKLKHAASYLEDARKELDSYRTEVGKIEKVKIIKVAGSRYADIKSYFKMNYNRFDPLNKSHIDNACDKATEKYNSLLEEIDGVHEGNKKAIANNKKVKQSVINFMKLVGIPDVYNTYFYKTSRSRNKTEKIHVAGFVSDINRVITTDDNYENQISQMKKFKEDIAKFKVEAGIKIGEETRQKEKADEVMRKLAMSVSFAKENNITEYRTNEELFSLVEEASRIKFQEENKGKDGKMPIVHGNFYDGYILPVAIDVDVDVEEDDDDDDEE
jgi:hypothetical protein